MAHQLLEGRARKNPEQPRGIIAERVRLARAARGWSQAKLCSVIERTSRRRVTGPWLAAYETGRRRPSVPVLCDLADALEVSLDYLTGRSETP